MNAPASISARTIPELLLERVAATPDRDAFLYPTDPGWGRLTWAEVGDRVRAIAGGLRALGLLPEQRCAILSGTRVEWILVDLGILSAGGATTTIYPSSAIDDVEYIVADSGAVFVFAENDAQVAKLVARRDQLPSVKQVIAIDGKGDGDWVIPLAELERRGAGAGAAEHEAAVRAVRPDALATLIYTSGTTGRPKGVELTHDCWIYEGEAVHSLGLLGPDDLQYLWLPLAHSFGKVLVAVQLRAGFATAVDGRVDKMVDNLAVVRPTFVCAVPRIFEKVHNKVVTGAQASAMKRAIFRWAMGVGHEVSKLVQKGESARGWLAFKRKLAHKLVFSKLQARFGGRVRFFISGSAALSREIAEFFHAAGILVLEGYGLTESSAASFVNRPDAYRFGTVGLPVPGTKVRIAEDGEILIGGRGIMRAYHNRPDDTRDALTIGASERSEDASSSPGSAGRDRPATEIHWLKTGDIGVLEEGGFLRITDRKKDLIKTSGGKYVAPQEIEGKLKATCPYVSQVLVHGNSRNFCSALITLDPDATKAWAAGHGLGDLSVEELTKRDELRALIQEHLDRLNGTLGKHETIKKFALLPAEFTESSGELTPSLKLKRKVIEQKYSTVLDAFYTGSLAKD